MAPNLSRLHTRRLPRPACKVISMSHSCSHVLVRKGRHAVGLADFLPGPRLPTGDSSSVLASDGRGRLTSEWLPSGCSLRAPCGWSRCTWELLAATERKVTGGATGMCVPGPVPRSSSGFSRGPQTVLPFSKPLPAPQREHPSAPNLNFESSLHSWKIPLVPGGHLQQEGPAGLIPLGSLYPVHRLLSR